jgi:hypothetical protein
MVGKILQKLYKTSHNTKLQGTNRIKNIIIYAWIIAVIAVVLAALTVLSMQPRPTTTTTVILTPTHYVEITLTNSQPAATPSPFQQMVTINSTNYRQYEAGNLDNVEFYYQNGTIIPSWLESGNSSTSTNTVYWLKLDSGIPASSSITIYMGFAPTATNLFNNETTGEAPQLSCGSTPASSCSTYAKYDDGASVFNFYDNFAGTSLNTTKWVSAVSGGNETVNNGLSLSAGETAGDYAYVASSKPVVSIPAIAEAYMKVNLTNASEYIMGFGMISTQSYLSNHINQDHISWQESQSQFSTSVQTGPLFINLNFINQTENSYNIWTLGWLNGKAESSYDNRSIFTTTSDVPSDVYFLTMSYFNYEGTTAARSLDFEWIRTRAYPPNGVMPSATFSSVQTG